LKILDIQRNTYPLALSFVNQTNAQISEYEATTRAEAAAAILKAYPGKQVNDSPGY
jgi:hypothetical protein